MFRVLQSAILAVVLSLSAAPLLSGQPSFTGASWIWADTEGDGVALADDPGGTVAYLRKSFELPASLLESGGWTFSVTADNAATAWLNGERLGRVDHWPTPLVREVSDLLRPGRNVLCLRAENAPLPKDAGGVIAKLWSTGGEGFSVVTDASWRGAATAPEGWTEPGFDDRLWRPAVSLVPAGGFPWGSGAPGLGGGWPAMPEFLLDGEGAPLTPLRDLIDRHYMPGITCTLWDPWMPRSLLWIGFPDSGLDEDLRRFYASSLLERRILSSGYVEMRQHRGLGLPEGWPFPLWTQGPGAGWHFSVAGNPFTAVHGIHLSREITGWELDGAAFSGFDNLEGLKLTLTESGASLTTPPFSAAKIVAPYLRLEWRAHGLPETAEPYLEWATEAQPEFTPQRRLYFDPVQAADGLVFTVLPLHEIPDWEGPLTRVRIHFDNPAGAKVAITALFTAVDSRKPVTNPDFILGSTDYFNWTGDLNFLRAQINRLRTAMDYVLDEFGVEENGLAYVGWPGHEGRSGLAWEDGVKRQRPGEGIGNNYFDLLPFGAWDAYLNVRVYAALGALAELEAAVERNPGWNLPGSPMRRSPGELEALAARLRENFQARLWNEETGRFVSAIDADGVAHDYGFSPVNMEAIVYGLASPEQARAIYAWLDGVRTVEGDTSRGEDIYHWRFAPRMTTRRNLDYYVYVWINPDQIAFGDQIQDGGAVLGFSYYDLLARIEVLGPQNAAHRLGAILQWYEEVQAYGGYRKYYADHEGTLQGGGPPGGLGLDQEFYETAMLPSVLLYGFLGLEPTPEGLAAAPRIPETWPSLTITHVAYRDWLLDLTAERDTRVLKVRVLEGDPEALPIQLPEEWTLEVSGK